MMKAASVLLPAAIPSSSITMAEKKGLLGQQKDAEGKNKKNLPPIRRRPKRPLSAYNLFLRYERARLLTLKKKQEQKQQCDDEHDDARRRTTPANLTPQSIRLLLSDHPYRIDRTKRRRHRKSHGVLSFRELSDHASRNWKALDAHSRESFDVLAREHRAAYDEEMAEYKRAAEATDLRRYGEACEAEEGVEPEGSRADAEEGGPRKKKAKTSASEEEEKLHRHRHQFPWQKCSMARVVSSSSLTCTVQQEEAQERPSAHEAFPTTLFMTAPFSSSSPSPQIAQDSNSAPRVPHVISPAPLSSPVGAAASGGGGGVYSQSRASANELMTSLSRSLLLMSHSSCETAKRPSDEEEQEMVAFMGGLDWSKY